MHIKDEPTRAFQMSSKSAIRILLHPRHPAVVDLQEGCWPKFHKQNARPHLTVTTPTAFRKRQKAGLAEFDFMKLGGKVVHPIENDDGFFDLSFAKKNGELMTMPWFKLRLSDLDAIQLSSGVWVFPL